MKKRFNVDSTTVTVSVIMLTPGFLMMALGFIGFKSVPMIILSLVVGTGVLVILWFGLARGTYITIDGNKNIYNTLFFFKVNTILLSDIVALTTRGTFMGAMTYIYATYPDKKGNLIKRTIVTKGVLRKEDFKKLMETIASANPNIDIPKELIK